MCCFCGMQDTAAHRYWHCRRLSTHTHPAVQQSNFLAAYLEEFGWAECFWHRGILPKELGH